MDANDTPRRWLKACAAGLLALLVALAGCGQARPDPALWRLADSDSEIWLFGTVHVLPAHLRWRSAAVDAAFARAETVVFEVDSGPEGVAELQRLFLERGYDRAGGPLSAKLDPEDRARLARVADDLGVGAAAFEPMRPWFAAMQMSMLFIEAQGHTPEYGVETVLGAEAAQAGKRFAYLETPAAQVGFLADLPPEAELRFLSASLRQIEEDGANAAAMDAAWARGDAERLAQLLFDTIDEAGPEVHAALVTERNRAWADRIEAMLAGEGRIFIAAGAAHFVGPESVVALLRARGHAIEGP